MPPSLADALNPLGPPPRLAVRPGLSLADLLVVGQREGQRYLLPLRFALINLVALALLVAVWLQGWLDQMVATDSYHLVKLNIGVFVVGLAMCGSRLLGLSRELNALGAGEPGQGSRAGRYLAEIRGVEAASRAIIADGLKMTLGARLAGIRHIASTIVLIGLTGTIIGFVIALSGVDAAAASDAQAIAPMISTLLLGMAIALYKTLVGSVLNIWLMLNYRLLEAGTVHLLTKTIARGERHARL